MSGERDDSLLLMLLEAALAMGILYFVNSLAHGRMKKDGSLFFPLLQATALLTVLLLWFGTRDSETLEAFKLVAGRDALVDVQELGKQLAASFKSIPRSIASTLLSVHDFDKSGTLNEFEYNSIASVAKTINLGYWLHPALGAKLLSMSSMKFFLAFVASAALCALLAFSCSFFMLTALMGAVFHRMLHWEVLFLCLLAASSVLAVVATLAWGLELGLIMTLGIYVTYTGVTAIDAVARGEDLSLRLLLPFL
jgi:hypothetical protein